jgi:serpin B
VYRRVALSLPKFRSEGRYSLVEVLKELGMIRAFTSDADFSKMVKEPAQIDAVVHQAFIDLDEKGTEAAAATYWRISGALPGLPPEPVEFRADRPFIYCLMDEQTGVILFMGRFLGPQ